MTRLNPTQAVEQWKVGKSTLYRAMNSGELSFTTDESGKRFIDTSELLRVYGEPGKTHSAPSSDSETVLVQSLREIIERQDKAHGDHIKALESQINSYEDKLNKLLDNQADTTKLLVHLQESVSKTPTEPPQSASVEPVMKQEEHPLPEPVPETPKPAKRKRSLFQRVLSAVVED